MGGVDKVASGPDLAAGVVASTLADGVPIVGHRDGEAVLLVRRGKDFFAVGAQCTHYGASLANGLVVDETIRCPLHHSCFNLRTGEPRGPALPPLACYRVETDDEIVRVGEKLATGAIGHTAIAPSSVVIVGAGATGAACAESLRARGFTGPVTLIGEEAPVDRPNLSKDFLAGIAPPEWLPLRPLEFYRDNGIELVLGDAATTLDVVARTITLASGRTIPYGALLLATGSRARRLRVPGADLPHVRTLRSARDAAEIIARARAGGHAVVVGSSFMSLEVTASLVARGMHVSIVSHSAPLQHVLGPEVAAEIRAMYEAKNVPLHIGNEPTLISATGVTLDTGAILPAELVVCGIGVEARIELAKAAGLQLDGGVLVDEQLGTSVDGVYAAGDIARFPNAFTDDTARVEHFAHAVRQGQAVARNMLGQGDAYADVPFFWSQLFDLELTYVGYAPKWDRIETSGSLRARDYAAAFLVDNRLAALLTVGRAQLSLEVEAAMERNDGAGALSLFRRT